MGHINNIHDGGKNHKCELCGKLFPQADNLKIHIKHIHDAGVKNYKCESCE